MVKRMKATQKKANCGFTLIEAMVAMVVIIIGVIGAMGFRAYCVMDAKKADVQVNAARIGSMLLESWKGTGGFPTYDPANPATQFGTLFSSQYAIAPTTAASAPLPSLLTKLTSCQIKDLSNNVYYYVTLSYQTDTIVIPAGVTVNVLALNASISWNQNYGAAGTTAHTIGITTYQD